VILKDNKNHGAIMWTKLLWTKKKEIDRSISFQVFL